MKFKPVLMLALLSVLLIPRGNNVESCSFPMYEDSRDVFFYFFDPGLALDARLRPLSFAGLPAATPAWDSTSDARKDNLEAWISHLKGRFRAEEIEKIIYDAPLAGLQAASVNPLAKVAPQVIERFAAHREDLDYLIFAKRCEPLVAPSADWDPWDEKDWHDLPAMAALLEEGKKLHQRATSPFLKDRYAFQIVRLAHYSGNHEQAVRLFDEYFPGLPRPGTIYYWSLALKAGALRRLERTAESAYLFSLVFERCRSKRFEAYRGFRIDSDEAYQECLKRCRDSRERSVVYFLHGIDLNNSALEEMESIYRELPDSPHLEVLLAREIARIERKLHGVSINERAAYWDWPLRDPDEVFRMNLERLTNFLQKAVTDNRVQRADFWKLAMGYALYLSGRLPAAREKLVAVRDNLQTTPAVRLQAETFLWLADVVALQAVDRESESRLFREYQRIRGHFPLYGPNEFNASYYSSTPWRDEPEMAADGSDAVLRDPKFRFLRSALMSLYAKQGDGVRAFLASEFQPGCPEPPRVFVRLESGPWPLNDIKAQRKLVDGLIAFASRRDRNEFENILLKLKYVSLGAAADVPRLLADQKGILLMRRCLWSEAAESLKNAVTPADEHAQLPDPFAEHALHPWGGSWDGGEEGPVMPDAGERLEFARAMEALTRKANAGGDSAACYRLGCALYNISYFGPCWGMLASSRSPAGDYDPDTTAFLFKEASRRFAQAEKAARDRELAARACFRQADIALKLYAVSEDCTKAHQALPYKSPDGTFIEYDQRQFAVLSSFINPHFPRLKQKYAFTAYYRQIVKECKLFEYYAHRR